MLDSNGEQVAGRGGSPVNPSRPTSPDERRRLTYAIHSDSREAARAASIFFDSGPLRPAISHKLRALLEDSSTQPPPRLATYLVYLFFPKHDGENIPGDLAEE